MKRMYWLGWLVWLGGVLTLIVDFLVPEMAHEWSKDLLLWSNGALTAAMICWMIVKREK